MHAAATLRTLLERAVHACHTGAAEQAEAAFRAALCLVPGHFDATHLLGVVLQQTRRAEAGVTLIRRATRINGAVADAHHNLGLALLLLGRTDEAHGAFDAALAANPGHMIARVCRVVARLPLAYRSVEEIALRRDDYRTDLEALASETAAASPGTRANWSAAVPELRPFFLTYQGLCDRDLQRLFGTVCHRLMAARFPAHAGPLAMPPPDAGGRLRIGILSGFFANHSNWKIRTRSWLERLDRRRYRLFGYHTQERQDADTRLAERLCDRFVQGPLPLERWVEEIRADDLHVLIIPEVGMDRAVVALAALRLAPVQAVSWGHPDTSGMPTIDYYLSSDLMEPDGAEAHYTETLVRLPNLSFYYMPRRPRPAAVSRAEIGVPEDAAMFWCCQSFAKYLPQFDALYARIARRVPGARFVFIRSYLSEAADRILEERLADAFAAEGVPFEGACIFLPLMGYDRFNAVAALADAALDTPAWSGCNTTLETLAHGVPVVTLPGDLMRGRHSLAILRMIGVTDTVAASPEDYIDIACRLALDPAWREEVSSRIRANIHRAYEDMEAIYGLERFIEEAVARMPASS